MELLSSLNEMSASEGLPIVLLSGLQAFGALALIAAVLVIMERVYKKKHHEGENKSDESTKVTDNNEISEEKGDNE